MAKKKIVHPEVEQTFISHLIELRNRLLHVLGAVLLVFLALVSFAGDIFSLLTGQIQGTLPGKFIAIDPTSPFFAPFKLTLIVSVFIAMPYVLYQIWAFIAPGLYKKEKKVLIPVVISSILLFYLGMAFAFYITIPMAMSFFANFAPVGVDYTPDINRLLDFSLALSFAFGIAFEVPVATFILVWTGVTTVDTLAAQRRYIIVGAFFFGMILTPPDVFSQTFLAVPMWVLFEVGLLVSRIFMKRRALEAADGDEEQEYRPMSPAEMDAELIRIEQEELKMEPDNGSGHSDKDQSPRIP